MIFLFASAFRGSGIIAKTGVKGKVLGLDRVTRWHGEVGAAPPEVQFRGVGDVIARSELWFRSREDGELAGEDGVAGRGRVRRAVKGW
jgi:hypothetical protein